jgi:hypothetical protein
MEYCIPDDPAGGDTEETTYSGQPNRVLLPYPYFLHNSWLNCPELPYSLQVGPWLRVDDDTSATN